MKGKVTGDIIARKRVELRAPAKLIGNITTPSVVIHEGVVFEGHCSMGGGAEAKMEKTDKKVALFPKEERIPKHAAAAIGGRQSRCQAARRWSTVSPRTSRQ